MGMWCWWTDCLTYLVYVWGQFCLVDSLDITSKPSSCTVDNTVLVVTHFLLVMVSGFYFMGKRCCSGRQGLCDQLQSKLIKNTNSMCSDAPSECEVSWIECSDTRKMNLNSLKWHCSWDLVNLTVLLMNLLQTFPTPPCTFPLFGKMSILC